MSGIVGSKLNIRGSGRIAKLGTDGQLLTSGGAGVQANYEDAPAWRITSWQSVVTASTLTAVAGNGLSNRYRLQMHVRLHFQHLQVLEIQSNL